VAQKLAEQARNFSRQRLSEIHHRLLEAELAIKTGRTEPELALDLLMVELCSNI
jgi:DNA polymerase III delta subunit